MRALALALVVATAAPALAQDAPAAAPKTKRVCHWVETGNPLDNKRVCSTVVLKEAAATPAAPAAPAEPAPAEVAMQTKPHG